MSRLLTRLSAVIAFTLLLVSPSLAFNVKPLETSEGQQVWFAEDHTLPMIAVTASLPAGAAFDPTGKNGLASMAAQLLDQGAGDLDAQAFQSALATRAIRLRASVERDYLVITLITLKANAPEAFRLLGLALAAPRFDADAVARVRAQSIQSVQQGEQDPEFVASRAFFKTYFAGHPYGNPISGDVAGLGKVTIADLKSFARTHWIKPGVRIAVAGDVDPETLRKYLAASFGALSAGGEPQIPPFERKASAGLHTVSMDVPQPAAVFAVPGLLRNDPDFLAAYLANHVLGGGGFSSRLMKEIREKRGLTYGVSSSLNTYRKAGLAAGSVATNAGAMGQTVTVLRETLQKYADEGPTEAELADAKTYLTGSYPMAFSSNVGITSQLNAFQRAGLPVDYVEKRNSMIEAVSLADVKRVARRLFDPQDLTILVAGDMPKQAVPATPAP